MNKESQKLECIVIGEDHYNTLNVIRALGEANIKVHIILVTKKKCTFCEKSKYIYDIHKLNDENEIIDFLELKYGNSSFKIPVLTTSDRTASLVDSNYLKLSKFLKLPNVNEAQGGIIKEMDKNIMTMKARESGFNCPDTFSLSLEEFRNVDLPNQQSILSSLKFPCLIKPEISSKGSKDNFRICNNTDELLESLNNLPLELERVLIQTYISNDEVFLIAGVRTPKKNYLFGTINKLKHGKKFNNLGLNSFGIYLPENQYQQQINIFLNKIGYFGPYSFEFVSHNNTNEVNKKGKPTPYFVEVNFRTDGLLFFYTKANCNIPAIWVYDNYGCESELKGQKIEKIYGMNEFQYLKNFFCFSSIFSNIRDLFRTHVFSVFSWKDPLPFFFKLLAHE